MKKRWLTRPTRTPHLALDLRPDLDLHLSHRPVLAGIRYFSGGWYPVSLAKGVSPMDDTPRSATSPTLLGRRQQQPNDQAAWEQFVERYGRLILAWCRQAHLQDADIEDITQIVLVKLADKMRTFAYDPSKSFRGWLRTLPPHVWRDFVEARQRAGR